MHVQLDSDRSSVRQEKRGNTQLGFVVVVVVCLFFVGFFCFCCCLFDFCLFCCCCCCCCCLTFQQHENVSQGRICSDNFTFCHTEIKVADQTFYLTQSRYTDTAPTNPSADPITPGAWQRRHWSANFFSLWHDSTRKNPHGASGNQAPDLPLSRLIARWH